MSANATKGGGDEPEDSGDLGRVSPGAGDRRRCRTRRDAQHVDVDESVDDDHAERLDDNDTEHDDHTAQLPEHVTLGDTDGACDERAPSLLK